MSESTVSRTTAGSVSDLLERMVPDPERPADLDSTWSYAGLGAGALESGVWEATAATWTEDDYPVEEVCVVLAGHLRLTDADGVAHDLRDGDAFHLPKGWSGTWEVVEDMRKFYVILP